MTRLGAWKKAGAVFGLCAAMAIAVQAQNFRTLVNFDFTNGGGPVGALVQGIDGSFYGTTSAGGESNNCPNDRGCGTIFRLTANGTLKTLYNFCPQSNCPDGYGPSGLVLASDGDFYGTTGWGGDFGNGTVFKISAAGVLTTIHSFFGSVEGGTPSSLIQASDGNFYGTNEGGGPNGGGTVFAITPAGELTTLYGLCDFVDCPDGPIGGVIQATDGNFYGTTLSGGGGTCDCGTVYKVTPRGDFVLMHSFDGTDGAKPEASLIQGTDGNFYGITTGQIAYPTVFKMTPEGTVTVLHTLKGSDGYLPFTPLIQGTDGNFYGTTFGGNNIFNVTPQGTFTTLHRFSGNDGGSPLAALLQSTNGKFYGTSSSNGRYGWGTAYSLSMGLGPFLAFVLNPAKVSQTFGILGQGFTGTTSVTLHGMPISFKVLSDTFLEATIPSGATTGYVVGASPHGTLTSNVPFRVLPQVLSFSPPSGPVGTVVTITGVSLTQANGVGFGDDIGAHFTVDSDTQVTATVPNGAKTGPIGVQTLGGIGISTAIFTVTP